MKLPRVYPILDTESLERRGIPPATAAAAWLDGGARILQLRHKAHWGREFLAAAQEVARLCREAGVPLVVNDRADFALLLEAGLHLGQDDLLPHDARKLLGSAALIGYSTHNSTQCGAAAYEPVDYLAIGPVFPTASKRDPGAAIGVAEVRRAREAAAKPLVAIGGVTLENASEVWAAGADSVALIAGMLPGAATAASLRSRMEEWQGLAAAVCA